MSILLGFLFVVGLFLFAYGFQFAANNKKPIIQNIGMITTGLIMAVTCGIYAGVLAEREIPKPLHTTKYNVKTEVVQEYTDGVETKVDTIYTFTLKK